MTTREEPDHRNTPGKDAMTERETFATAINCMDGRVQRPVTEWLQKTFGVDYVDMITEPSPNKILAGREPGATDSIRRRVDISVRVHGSQVVALVAHAECAGNPVPKSENLQHLREGIEAIRAWGLPVTAVGLWLDRPDWRVEQVVLIAPD